MCLTLHLLGPPEMALDGRPVAGLNSDKVRALLFYLAVEARRAHRRESLAGLLWPDYPERSARINLSNALSNLRAALGDREAAGPFFHVSREAIQFNAQCDASVDVWAFEGHVAHGEWEEAIELYRGPFLEGFSLSDSPPFEQWALVVRERLQRQVMAALDGLTAKSEAQGDYPRAAETARRQLEIEPWHEGAMRALMRALALSGQRASALAQYEACARTLKEELDAAPSPETVALYEDIRKNKIAPRRETPRRQEAVPAPTEQPPTSPAAPAPVGERRWVTALHAQVHQAADLLDELGPEEWTEAIARALDLVQEQIQRYGGEVMERHDDGLVALFGLPSAHEDDPERALLAALGVQAETRDVPELRVGVEAGEVLVTYMGGRRQAVGRALALARRASVAAEPGTVLVGDNVHRLTGPLFVWETPEGHAARKVYRPLARKADVGKARGIPGLSSPLVGRDDELRALQQALDRLQSGMGGIVTLVGEAGLGKSRLVAEARTAVGALREAPLRREPPPQWIEGRCLSYAANTAYQLWLDLLHTLLGTAPEAPPLAVRDALQAQVRALCPDGYEAVYPYLCRLLSVPLEETYSAARNARGESLRAEVFYALETLAESAAQRRSLVVVCEDLHWADPTSLALLERLLPLTDRVPLLLLCVFRPEREHGCWRIREDVVRRCAHRHTDLWLRPLPQDHCETLVDNLLHVADLPDPLRTKILDRAQGNPFYVEEILRSLIESGAIAQDEATGRWQAKRDVDTVVLPDTLHGMLTARIDRLPPDAKRVLQLASVVGRLFSYPLLAEIASRIPLPEGGGTRGRVRTAPLEADLLALQRAQLIRERTRVPEREYIFQHVLTQEAAYDSLLKGERRTCHRQVAEALERLHAGQIEEQLGLLAHHWARAEEREKAVEHLLRAGEQARTTYANEEAIDYYRRALTLLEDTPPGEACREWRLTALSGLGIVRFGMGEVSQAEGPLQEAIALGKEMRMPPRKMVRLYYWLGDVLWWQARYDDLMLVAEESLALLGEGPGSLEAALANQLAAMAYSAKGSGDKALEFIHRTERFIERVPYVEELRPAYDWIIMTKYASEKEVEGAMRWIHSLEEKATLHHDLRALGEAHCEAGRILGATGDLHGAIPRSRQSLRTYARIGDAKNKSWPLLDMGQSFLALGDMQRAEEYAHRYLKNAKEVGDKRDMGLAYQDVGRVLLCQGNLEEAAEAVQRVASLGREIGLPPMEASGWVLLGQVCLAQGDRQEARGCFQDAIAAFPRKGFLCQHRQTFTLAVGGLEEAYQSPKAFRALCSRLREEDFETGDWPLTQWYLEPAEPGIHGRVLLHDNFVTDLSSGWTWEDPFGDCSYAVKNGLEICAANGRDLWHINLSGPRMLRPASLALPALGPQAQVSGAEGGDLIIQTTCLPVSDEVPTIGGLLLWAERENYLRLDRGVFGKQDISLMGCLGNEDVIIGRGRLDINVPGRVYLRLERADDQVNAYCSADGEGWFTVGHTAFPVDDPVQVGLHAIGNIDRTIYHGAFPDGTAIRFESFQMWRGDVH